MAYTPSYQFMGPNVGYVPVFDETARLVVGYSRDWKKNIVNNLMTLIPVKRELGTYPKINPQTAINVTDKYLQSRMWTDGQVAPIDQTAHTQIEWRSYFCQRYMEGEVLGWKMRDQSAFDIRQVMIDQLARRMMVGKAYEFYTIMQDTNSYLSAAVDTATNFGGGQWSAATSTNRYIQKTISTCVEQIVKATAGGVSAKDLVLVVGPVVAHKMAASGEIADYLGQNPIAKDFLEGDLWVDQLARYNLPPTLYGVKIVVDDNVRTTSALGATVSTSFMSGDTSAYLIARPGTLVGTAGGRSFSFISSFQYEAEEMLVETVDDPNNKRELLRVTDSRHILATAPEAACLITAAVA